MSMAAAEAEDAAAADFVPPCSEGVGSASVAPLITSCVEMMTQLITSCVEAMASPWLGLVREKGKRGGIGEG